MSEQNLGAGKTGFHDWYWQRISAAVLLLSTPVLAILSWMIFNGSLDYNTLHQLFTHPLGKSATTLYLLALLLHLWTGLKVIFEDYIHTSSGRVIILNALLLTLLFIALYMTYHIWAELSYSFSCAPCSKGEV